MQTDELLKQLDTAISLCRGALSAAENATHSSSNDIRNSEAATIALALAELITGRGSIYYVQVKTEIDNNRLSSWAHLPSVTGVLIALRKAVSEGLLTTISGEIRGELFYDFLERATALLMENHKDAAAVVAGSVLEEHLRQLCGTHDIDLNLPADGGLRPKKADLLNAELAKTGAYSKLDQKSITAWLDLRNKAAHGQYDEYQKEQVSILISGIRDFVGRVKV